jgi:adenylosuccinate synthase
MPDAHPLAVKLKQLEFGTSTGRQRMVGWFDAVEKGDALRFGGFEDLVINKLDAMSYSDSWHGGEILVCTAYRDSEGKKHISVPRNDSVRKGLIPIYRQLEGWDEDISLVRSFANLPAAAKRYVGVMYKSVVDVANRGDKHTILPNLRYIGVGPDTSQIIRDIPLPQELIQLGK